MAVLLSKGDAPVSLIKKPGAVIDVTLSWTSKTDVDLACMYQLTDGSQPRVVQALDKNFGSLNSAPYVLLSGDDRSGGSENLKINLAKADEIKRLLVFAFIYAGSNWKKVGDAQVRIQNPVGGDDYLIRLEGAKAASCALIDLQNDGSGNLRMTRLEQYFRGFHQDIDSYYGWPNINWVKGSKD